MSPRRRIKHFIAGGAGSGRLKTVFPPPAQVRPSSLKIHNSHLRLCLLSCAAPKLLPHVTKLRVK